MDGEKDPGSTTKNKVKVATKPASKKIKPQKKITQFRKTTKGIVQTPKLELFFEEFLKNGGNATKAAIAVFNVSNVESAASMGSAYLKKAKGLGRLYLEKQGYSYGRMLDIAAQKMEQSEKPDWWDRVMKIADYEDFFSAKRTGGAPTTVNILQTQKSLAKEFGFEADVIDGEEVKDDGTEEL